MEPRRVHLEPAAAELPDDAQGLALLRAVRGRGRDHAGLVEIELDALGDVVEVTVGEGVTARSGSALAEAITEAFRAARAATTARLEEHADELVHRTRRESDENVRRLEAVAAQARQQFDEMAAKLTALAAKER